jgi:hypothetical protein
MIVVDRIEADVAVVEAAGMWVKIPLSVFPQGTREGDAFRFERVPRDDDEAEARLARLKASSKQGPGTFDL